MLLIPQALTLCFLPLLFCLFSPMAAGAPNHAVTLPNIANGTTNQNKQTQVTENHHKVVDYWQRAQWLRAAVLGANDGLISVASLMMGVGAVKRDAKAMLLAGFAGLVAGSCGMAIGEFVSVYTQYEVEVAQMKRDVIKCEQGERDLEMAMEKRKSIPNPLQAALASAFSFSIGGLVPLLSGAFITVYMIRLLVIVVVVSLALVVFGSVGSLLGKTPMTSSCVRFMIGGWLAMAITFGLTKLLGAGGFEL